MKNIIFIVFLTIGGNLTAQFNCQSTKSLSSIRNNAPINYNSRSDTADLQKLAFENRMVKLLHGVHIFPDAKAIPALVRRAPDSNMNGDFSPKAFEHIQGSRASVRKQIHLAIH